jgi:hypothetical protein
MSTDTKNNSVVLTEASQQSKPPVKIEVSLLAKPKMYSQITLKVYERT